MIDDMGPCLSLGKFILNGINRDAAHRGRINGMNPPYGLFRKGLLESSKGGVGDELGTRNSVKEISSQNFPGQFHDPKGSKKPGPSE